MTQTSAAARAEPVDPSTSTDQRRALAALLLATRSGSHRPAPDTIPALPRDRDSYPCSSQQRRIWLASRVDVDGVAMPNATAGIRLRGPLDPTALAAALAALAARHEALRTVFWPDGPAGTEPRQRILSTVDARLEQIDLSGLPSAEREVRAEVLAATATGERFDLATGPLFRITTFRLGPDDHALLLVCHHIVLDEQSVDLVLADLARLYAARRAGTADPPPPARQYVDYASWSADALAPPERERRQQWWRTQLAAPRSELELPFAVAGGGTRVGASQTAYLPAGVLDRLRQAGGGATTPFVALLTVLELLLVRYTGQPDLTVGTIAAGRDRTAWEPVVGCFLDLLALRTDLTMATSFATAAARVRATVAGAFTHQLPFDEVVALANPDRSRRTHPLFPVAFTMMRERTEHGPWPDLAVEVWHHRVDPGGLDLTVEATPATDGSVRVVFKHRPDEHEPGAVARLARHFETFASNLAADPTRPLDRVSVLPAAELAELRALGGGPAPPVPSATVLDQVRRQAQATPDATAVASGDTRLSYRELLTAAEELAGRLRRAGVGRGALVAICLERSADLVVAPLAVWTAGAAWVPVDPEHPADRQALVIADSGAAVVLTHQALTDRLPAHGTTILCLDDPTAAEAGAPAAAAAPAASPRPGETAYVLYTSGSTGRPKGVVVTHHNLTNFIMAMGHLLDSAPEHRWLAVTSLAFDIAGLELWLPLVTGARLVMVPDAVVRDGWALATLVTTHRVSHVQTTPSTWRLLLAGGLRPDPALVGLVGGEALPPPLAGELRAVTGRLINVYGPTETTVWSTTWEVPDPVADVTIGTPIANTQVYVHDGYGELVPRGVPGELCIGGDGVATGYLNRPALTATRFVPDPYGPPGARLYRTGDRVRWRGDGTLEFLGRIDHQVKIRGYRIEPGEIEARLLEHPHISQVAVVVRPDPAGEPNLVGYLVTTDGADPDPRELRAFVGGALPAYMVPPQLLRLDALPLTPNGKLDRAALPDPPRGGTGAARVPPRTATEQLVAQVWAPVLGLAEVSADDDFFDLGGHSLLALQVMARLRAEIGLTLPVHLCFEHPTVAGLAAAIEQRVLAEIGAMSAPEADQIFTGERRS